MKKIRFYLLFISALCSSAVYANEAFIDSRYNTYFGVSYKQNWIKAKDQWHSLFIEPKPGFNFYLGWRFHSYLATEFGYEWTANKPCVLAVPKNTSLLGIRNNTNTTIDMQSKLRLKTGYIDLNAFIPFPFLNEIKPELILSVGVASIKPSIKIYPTPLTSATLPFTSQFSYIQGKSKAVFRAGLGLQTLLIENVGVRVIWHFENTSVLRARNSVVTENPSTRQLFKDAQTLGVGLFLKF